MPCELCEFAVTKLDEMIEDKNNEQQIKDALDSLCTYLPNSIAKECKNFVDTYTDVVIEMLTNDVTPEQVMYDESIDGKYFRPCITFKWNKIRVFSCLFQTKFYMDYSFAPNCDYVPQMFRIMIYQAKMLMIMILVRKVKKT